MKTAAHPLPIFVYFRTFSVLCSVIVVTAAVLSVRVISPGTTEPKMREPRASPRLNSADTREVAVKTLLADRAEALMTRDSTGWLAPIDETDRTFMAEQQTVYQRLQKLPIAQWRYEVLGVGPSLSPDSLTQLGSDAWTVSVNVKYRLRNFDLTDSTFQQAFTVVRREGEWRLTNDGLDPNFSPPQIWDLGPIKVRKEGRILAFGTAPLAEINQVVQEANRAIDQVSNVWDQSWQRQAVLVVPETQEEFGAVLKRPPQGLGQIAAVTTGTLKVQPTLPGTRAGNDRVVINSVALSELGDLGRRLVLQHELTHVAVRQSTTRDVPLWLSEGFADYIGYRNSGVAVSFAAQDLLGKVAVGQIPSRLPEAVDFDPTRTSIAESYSGAWLACKLIADQYGQERLVEFYQDAADGPGNSEQAIAQAFRDVLNTTQKDFTQDWQNYLIALGDK
ncbi:MAG: peptidase MA family metallohydrolase [Actinomycetota bacterium]